MPNLPDKFWHLSHVMRHGEEIGRLFKGGRYLVTSKGPDSQDMLKDHVILTFQLLDESTEAWEAHWVEDEGNTLQGLALVTPDETWLALTLYNIKIIAEIIPPPKPKGRKPKVKVPAENENSEINSNIPPEPKEPSEEIFAPPNRQIHSLILWQIAEEGNVLLGRKLSPEDSSLLTLEARREVILPTGENEEEQINLLRQEGLRRWRTMAARISGKRAYGIMFDHYLEAVAALENPDAASVEQILGPARFLQYGEQILLVLALAPWELRLRKAEQLRQSGRWNPRWIAAYDQVRQEIGQREFRLKALLDNLAPVIFKRERALPTEEDEHEETEL